MTKKLTLLACAFLALYWLIDRELERTWTPEPRIPPARESSADLTPGFEELLASAFEQGLNDVQVVGEGRVLRTLPDDTKGSRHQRFLLELSTGQTLLVAHNIDLAPRISSLRPGDRVTFSGVYEWNPEGGVIHWTHHDPRGRHPGGWLEHEGRRYR